MALESASPSSPSELPLPGDSRVRSVQTPQPRRGIAGVGLAVALLILGVARFVGGRLGFDRIRQGGVNLRLLPEAGGLAPDVTVALTDGTPVRLLDFRGQPAWLNFRTRIPIDRDGIVRDNVFAELNQEEIIDHTQAILPDDVKA